MTKIPRHVQIITVSFMLFVYSGLLGDCSYAQQSATSTNRSDSHQISTNSVNWIKSFGPLSLSALNSKCDLLVIGSVGEMPRLVGRYFVTEITIESVLAAKLANSKGGGSIENLGTNLTKAAIWLDLNAGTHQRPAAPPFLSGGKFLLWLNRVEATPASDSSNPNSLSLLRPGNPVPASARFAVTHGVVGAYVLNSNEVRDRYRKLRTPLYPWQEQFLNHLIGTDDIARFKQIVVDTARALKNDKASPIVLKSLAKSRADPVLGRIAQEHLDKGITNIFNYVNPDPIP